MALTLEHAAAIVAEVARDYAAQFELIVAASRGWTDRLEVLVGVRGSETPLVRMWTVTREDRVTPERELRGELDRLALSRG